MLQLFTLCRDPLVPVRLPNRHIDKKAPPIELDGSVECLVAALLHERPESHDIASQDIGRKQNLLATTQNRGLAENGSEAVQRLSQVLPRLDLTMRPPKE